MKRIIHLELSEANEFVTRLHRHHKHSPRHRFSIGWIVDGRLVRVAIVGQPVARLTDRFRIVEVTRLCTDGTPNACSVLYGAAARCARELGFDEIQTFILQSESGVSLRAAGWEEVPVTPGTRAWNRGKRPRQDQHPLGPKRKFRKVLTAAPISPRARAEMIEQISDGQDDRPRQVSILEVIA